VNSNAISSFTDHDCNDVFSCELTTGFGASTWLVTAATGTIVA